MGGAPLAVAMAARALAREASRSLVGGDAAGIVTTRKDKDSCQPLWCQPLSSTERTGEVES